MSRLERMSTQEGEKECGKTVLVKTPIEKIFFRYLLDKSEKIVYNSNMNSEQFKSEQLKRKQAGKLKECQNTGSKSD